MTKDDAPVVIDTVAAPISGLDEGRAAHLVTLATGTRRQAFDDLVAREQRPPARMGALWEAVRRVGASTRPARRGQRARPRPR